MKKQKENSHEGITWSEMRKQNVQAEKVYWTQRFDDSAPSFSSEKRKKIDNFIYKSVRGDET